MTAVETQGDHRERWEALREMCYLLVAQVKSGLGVVVLTLIFALGVIWALGLGSFCLGRERQFCRLHCYTVLMPLAPLLQIIPLQITEHGKVKLVSTSSLPPFVLVPLV